MIIKNIDLAQSSVWSVNHKLRNFNSINLSDLQTMCTYFSKKDEINYHITTIVNQATGFNCWQLSDTYN